MTRKCSLTGVSVLTGNNVSHANNKTKRRFLPNLQSKSLYSEKLGRGVRLRVATSAIRTIEACGGLDKFLILTKPCDLSPKLNTIRSAIIAAQ